MRFKDFKEILDGRMKVQWGIQWIKNRKLDNLQEVGKVVVVLVIPSWQIM